jgi:hypothetical protein
MPQQENWCLFRISSHLHVAIWHANPSVMHRLPQAQLSFVLIPQFAGKFSLKTKALFRGNDGMQRVKIFQAPKLLAFVAYETRAECRQTGSSL